MEATFGHLWNMSRKNRSRQDSSNGCNDISGGETVQQCAVSFFGVWFHQRHEKLPVSYQDTDRCLFKRGNGAQH